ncbi:hypothetical protein [Brachybacterium sp. J153]|uniref:hypothetical protein n=1 Tax=Brachybacterium sp. J153 TaxID=3116488 RepID=UPI002E78BC93|nr:hypothetical protein [Brachybacterium sp. J153]MEE1619744.1 hypothetical protein [Brachybacterium sp. J153]
MATTPTPEEAVERARRAQDQRIEAVRVLAQARQNLTDERADADRRRADLEEQIKEGLRRVEAEDVKAFNAATAAGWTLEELRRIGLPEPEKKRRARRRTVARSKAGKSASDDAENSAAERPEAAPVTE